MIVGEMTLEIAKKLVVLSAKRQDYHNCMGLPSDVYLDFETRSEEDLKKFGQDRYAHHPSTHPLMVTWCEIRPDGNHWFHWNTEMGQFPNRLIAIFCDPKVLKHAFNAQFERTIAKFSMGLEDNIRYTDWRCTMVLAYMMGFGGTLAQIGAAIGLKEQAKLDTGKDLIKFFSIPVPEKQRAKVGSMFREPSAFPEEWFAYCVYNVMDVAAEMGIAARLDQPEKYPIPPSEWATYAIDQEINDRGVPIDLRMAENAIRLKDRRKEELVEELRQITGLDNPNSTSQLLPWLRARGYPFNDCKAASVKTALNRFSHKLTEDCIVVLKKRKWAASTSHGKYSTIANASRAGRFRYSLQMAGAQRTQRWAGRRVQTQNLPRTPKCLEPKDGDIRRLNVTTEIIRNGRYDELALWMKEPMEAIVGCIRSTFRAEEDHEFRVCDLASIESVVIGWISDCKWFQEVLANGRDIYKSFAMHLYDKAYDEVMKAERSMAKPATLGCGYRLGGGDETETFTRTGLWGYAENMGVEMTKEEATQHVKVFRELCPEIVDLWFELEKAAFRCLKTKQPVQCGRVTFEFRKPFLAIRLPSGRRLWYFQPRVLPVTRKFKNKYVEEWVDTATGEITKHERYKEESYTKYQLSYMGMDQKTRKWSRQYTHGGKLVENIVQAIARDVLKAGIIRATRDGFQIVMHIHDEIVCHEKRNDLYHTQSRLQEHMTAPLSWAPGMHLGGAGWTGPFYMKD